ncbi:LADA_0C08218g1_1 [Lachancea dasiensis]|uniref:LADA_0C08218g1_1 n=1 Tax=Lachancea dasiensis TaxID=1072105 RepID=A0A1G4IZV4_9SACH|nr:LADA_0C08218g1_1 [Lachancea dasiensis]
MAKASKATKKFQTKHLKHTLDHRKKLKNHAKKTKGRRGNKSEQEKEEAALTKEEQKMRDSAKEEVFKDMSVEDFFAGGFEVPKKQGKGKRGKENKPEEKQQEEEDVSSSEDEAGMVENMAGLAEKDPEFYKYLQENDQELLNFEGTNPLDAISDGEDEDDDGEDMVDGSGLKEGVSSKSNGQSDDVDKTTTEVDLKLVKKWKKELGASSLSIKLVRNIVSAFKAAVNANREDLVDTYKFAVIDGKAFQELMFLALKDMPAAILKAHPYQITKGARTLPNNSNVTKVSSVLKSHAGSMITMLHDITNTGSAALVLHSLDQILPYFLSYRRIIKEIVKSVVELGATTRDLETQITAFAFLNNASREFKKSILDTVLKTTYSSFIKSCRKTNIRTMPLINFQKNSSAELFGIDEVLGYQIGFEYVRQLAIHLRNSINATTKKSAKVNPAEAYKIVYNWQFCHSLDFWSRVLCAQCNPEKENGTESQLRQLIYPLVQVTIGVIRLIPTAQFFPLRFYLIKSLIRLSQNTGTFIPIYPLLSEILSSTAFTKVPKKKSTLPAFDFEHNIKCNQGYLGTKVYQDGLGDQFIELICEYFVLYCKSVSFPELSTPAYIALRRYIKSSKNSKFNKQVSNVLEKLKQNSDFVLNKRSEIDFSPTNRAEVERFLNDLAWNKTPLGSYVAVQREVKEEKARILRESVAEDDEESNVQQPSDDDMEDVQMSDSSDN